MLLKYTLRHAVLAEIQNGSRAGKELEDFPPRGPLSLQLLASATVDVEDSRDTQFELVKIGPDQGPECEHSRLTALCYLQETHTHVKKKPYTVPATICITVYVHTHRDSTFFTIPE